VKGTGPIPDWYNATKYKSVDEQAKAQRELEKRFGAFTGAPKDGKYTFKMPEGIEGEFDQEDPKFVAFNKWAVDNHLSQEGYQAILGMYAENLAALTPNFDDIKKSMGDKADERIAAAAQWAKANLDNAGYESFRAATSGSNAAEVFAVVEAVINKTRQVALPKPGDADPTKTALSPQATVDAMMKEKMPDGKLRFFEDAAFRADVERRRVEIAAAAQAA